MSKKQDPKVISYFIMDSDTKTLTIIVDNFHYWNNCELR